MGRARRYGKQASEFDSQQLRTSHSTCNTISLEMSELYRSAISARLAKLPPSLQIAQNEDEEEEMVDTIGDLPGSGIGPPAMQVNLL